jgi:ankyrin repeat protein
MKKHLNAGLSVNYIFDTINNSLLLLSIERGGPKIAKYLIDNGADIHIKNGFGDNALITTAANGYYKVVNYLLKRNAKPNVKNFMGETALYKAVEGYTKTRPHKKDIRLKYMKAIIPLLKVSMTANIKPYGNKHLVYQVIATERSKLFGMFLKKGIKQDLEVLKELLEILIKFHDLPEGKEYTKMLEMLLKAGVKPKYLLHKAANIRIGKLLIKYGDKPKQSYVYDNKKFASKEVEELIYPTSK